MKIIKLKNVKKLEIFNTHYKIKLKGIIKCISAINVFILETHGKLYALMPNIEDIKFFENIDTAEKFKEEFYEMGIVYYDYNDEVILEEGLDFVSNVFSVRKVQRRYYDARTMASKTMLIDELVLNPEVDRELENNRTKYEVDKTDFVNKLYGLNKTKISKETYNKVQEMLKVANEFLDDYSKGIYKLDDTQKELVADAYKELLKIEELLKEM